MNLSPTFIFFDASDEEYEEGDGEVEDLFKYFENREIFECQKFESRNFHFLEKLKVGSLIFTYYN